MKAYFAFYTCFQIFLLTDLFWNSLFHFRLPLKSHPKLVILGQLCSHRTPHEVTWVTPVAFTEHTFNLQAWDSCLSSFSAVKNVHVIAKNVWCILSLIKEFKTFLCAAHLQLLSGCPSLPVLAPDQICSEAVSENVNNTLILRCFPTAARRSTAWGGDGAGAWRVGRVSWEGAELVIMEKHLAPFPSEERQELQPNHSLLRNQGSVGSDNKITMPSPSPVPAYTHSPLYLWKAAAKPNIRWWKTNTTPSARHLTGCRWLRDSDL